MIMDASCKKEVSIILVGVGGYGKNYLDALTGRDAPNAGQREAHLPIRIAGAIEIAQTARSMASERGIPLFDSLESFYANRRADLAILSTPIHMHSEQIKICLAHGSDVLCEKPLCAAADDVNDITRAAEAAGRSVWVGYQMSFSRSVLTLKNDILSGAFGKPLIFKTLVHYPRDESYYARNTWAGRKRSADGRLILDSPAHNACAHHLNNMLFLLGDAPDKAATLKSVQAELYRGNPDVENFDTAAIRCITESGVTVLFYTSHSLSKPKNIGPINQFRFERATVAHIDEREYEVFYALPDDGSSKSYCPQAADEMNKLWGCIEAVRGGAQPPGGVEAAASEVYCINGAQLSHPIVTIPGEYVNRIGEKGKRQTEVAGLEKLFYDCFNELKLPSELGVARRAPWVTAGRVVTLPEIADINNKL